MCSSPARPARLALVLGLTFCLVSLAGCDGVDLGSSEDSTVADAQAPADPCLDVTMRVAEGALGSPVGEPGREQITDAGNPVVTCRWVPTGTLDPALALTVVAVTYPSEEEAVAAFDAQKDAQKKAADTTAVDGVGDAAFVTGAPPVLVSRTANVVARFDLGTQADPARQERLAEVARTVDRRLRA
ncbi:MAG: hypothetical protein IT198_05900 [Acidimicrobiia bacterium]|nr:hypothetical protein [Acidimicrobiia bacterium]